MREVPISHTISETEPSSVTGLVNASGRSPEVVAFEDAWVGFFIQAAEVLGVPKSVAAIYAICFASPEPLAFSEVRERLKISAGSISQGLRVLREVGALRVVVSGIDHRECFTPDLELRNLVGRYLEQRLQKQLLVGHEHLQLIRKAVPPGTTENAKLLRARIKALQTWHKKASAVLPLVKTFLKLT